MTMRFATWMTGGACALAIASASIAMQEGGGRTAPPPPPVRSIFAFEDMPVTGDVAGGPALASTAVMGRLRDVVALTEATRQPTDVIWGRIAGHAGDRAIAGYMQRQFAAIGLKPVALPEIKLGPQWHPVRLALTLEAGGQSITLKSAFIGDGSPATPSDGLDVPLVWGGMGSDADLAGKDVRGKAVVMRSLPKPASFFSTGRSVGSAMTKRGAAMVIVIEDGSPEGQFLLPGQRTSGVPVFTVASADGTRLESALASGSSSAHVRAQLDVEREAGLTTRNVVAMLPGRTKDVVLVTAHMDAYFDGANDNASGLAVLLSLARALKQRGQLDKTYVFAATTGHHTEEFSPGSKQIIDALPDMIARTKLVLNVEHVAAIDNKDWYGGAAMGGVPDGRHTGNTQTSKFFCMSPANPRLFDLVSKIVNRHGITVERAVWSTVPGDATPFSRAGLLTMQLIDIGYWYHSSLDTPATVSSAGLERVSRGYFDLLTTIDRAGI
jgi:hypothetical protein